MEITILPKDYIITTYDPYCNVQFSDFMLRALRIKNITTKMLEIQNLSFILKKDGHVIKEQGYSSEALKYWIPQWQRNIHISEKSEIL